MLHNYFFRTIGPAVYAGTGGVAETNWAEEMATYLSGSETSAASLDFKQKSFWIDNQTTPAKSGLGKRTNGSPWTTDADDYLGVLVDPYVDVSTSMWSALNRVAIITIGENGYFELPPMNAMTTTAAASAATITTDSETAPDGTNPNLVTITSSTGYVAWYGCSQGPNYVLSQYGTRLICWLKAGNHDIWQIRYGTAGADFNSERYLNIDLSDGTIGDYGSHIDPSTVSATLVSDGYYKVVADIYFGTTTIGYPYIRLTSTTSLTSAFNASSTTSATCYWWRTQHTHPWCVDEYVSMSTTSYPRMGPVFAHDHDGNSYGLFSNTRPSTVTSVYTDISGADWGDWSTATTATNCTVTSGQALSFFPAYDIGGLMTGSSAGGTGTVSIEFEPFFSTSVAGGDVVTSFLYLKAGTATKGYVSFTDPSSKFKAGNEALWYFDLSKGQIYDPEIEEAQSIQHSTMFDDPFNCCGSALVKVNDDWWCFVSSTYQTGSYNTGAYTLGLCDAVGSKTRTLDGATMSFYQGTFISDIGSDQFFVSLFPVLLMSPQEGADWCYQSYINLNDKIEFDQTSYSISMAYTPTFMGDAIYNYIDSPDQVYYNLQVSGNGLVVYLGGSLSGSIASSVSPEQQDFTGGTYMPGGWTKYAWSSDGDGLFVNRWNTTIGTDTGYTPDASPPNQFGLGGLIDSVTILNRVPTEADLQDICYQKTLSVENKLYSGGADLLVLKQDDHTTGIEVTNLAALVLRSTAGT